MAITVLANAQTLHDQLDRLNEEGADTQVAGIDRRGQTFLAYLRGPYADTVGVLVNDPWDGETDVIGCERPCDECCAMGPVSPDQLQYPVTVLYREQCPFGADVPAKGQRVFETGRKVRHRSSGTVYTMVSFDNDVVRLDSAEGSTSYEAVGTPFWAKYYAIADRPTAPTVTITEG